MGSPVLWQPESRPRTRFQAKMESAVRPEVEYQSDCDWDQPGYGATTRKKLSAGADHSVRKENSTRLTRKVDSTLDSPHCESPSKNLVIPQPIY
jgi:hypothetical protein